MSVYVFLGLGFVSFLVCLRAVKLVPKIRGVVTQSQAAMSVMRAAEISDEEKETRIRQVAIRITGAFFSIIVRTAICIFLPYGIVLTGIYMGLFDQGMALGAALNWYFIIGSTIVAIIAFRLVK